MTGVSEVGGESPEPPGIAGTPKSPRVSRSPSGIDSPVIRNDTQGSTAGEVGKVICSSGNKRGIGLLTVSSLIFTLPPGQLGPGIENTVRKDIKRTLKASEIRASVKTEINSKIRQGLTGIILDMNH